MDQNSFAKILFQERLSETKVANNSNADWIENQNWEQFTGKELPAVETKILKLEADIAQEVKECKVIKSLTEYQCDINMEHDAQIQLGNMQIHSEQGILLSIYSEKLR